MLRSLLSPSPSRWSVRSWKSLASVLSGASAGSVLSFGSFASAGSLLSIGSAGSILSIGSSGSILSIGSSGSILSIGGSGAYRNDRMSDTETAVVPPNGVTLLGAGLAVAGLLAAAVRRQSSNVTSSRRML